MVARSVTALGLLAAIVVAPLWLTTGRAHACTCVPLDLRREAVQADLIVLGDVALAATSTSDGYDFTVSVGEYLKGSGPDTITIRGSLGSTACSPFETSPAGGSYLLILYREPDERLGTSTCSGSVIASEDSAQARIEQIRLLVPRPPPQLAPSPTVDNKTSAARWRWWAIGGAIAATAAGGAAAILFLRRGTRRA